MEQTIQHTQGPQTSTSYGRPIEIEEFSNRVFVHPLSDKVVDVCIRWHISANVVSFAGLACGLVAAVAYFQTPNPLYVLLGFVLMVSWHILDGADGRLARATGTSSAFGRVIDGICDHLVYASVYIALALNLIAEGYGASIWFLVVGAGLSHAVQAAGYEERRQKYQRRDKGLDRGEVAEKLLSVDGKKSYLADVYDKAQKLVAGQDYGLDAALEELRASASHQQLSFLVLERTAKVVKSWSALNANNRTLLMFLFCLVGAPEAYFAFELVVLNIVLFGLIVAERRVETELAKTIRNA